MLLGGVDTQVPLETEGGEEPTGTYKLCLAVRPASWSVAQSGAWMPVASDFVYVEILGYTVPRRGLLMAAGASPTGTRAT